MSTVHLCQRSVVFGPGGDQDHRRSLRDDSEEISQQRLAGRIDPVHILDDEQRRCGASQQRSVYQGGQPAPTRTRINLRQLDVGVGNTEQVIE